MTLAHNHITSFPTNMSENKFSSRFYVSITAAKAVSREDNHYLALLLCEHGHRIKLQGSLEKGDNWAIHCNTLDILHLQIHAM